MQNSPSLQNLVNRINLLQKYKMKYPEYEEMIDKMKTKAEKDIVETVLQNDGSVFLEKIFHK